jgi:hypothetical protein
MATVVITSLSSTASVYLSDLYLTLTPLEVVTIQRPSSALPAMVNLQQAIQAGAISVVVTPTAAELASGYYTTFNEAVVPNTVLTQAVWFIDPANASGKASNKNDGLTATTPLLTHAELTYRRSVAAANSIYNGSFPILQNTTVTYLSAPASPYADPITLNVTRTGSFTLNYVYAATTTRTGVFTALTVRGGVNYWKATGAFGSADVQKLCINTTKGTAFWVNAVSGGIADTTEFMTTQTTPFNGFFPPPALIAPANTDAYSVMGLCRVHLGLINVDGAPTAAGTLRVACVSFLNFQIAADNSSPGFGYPDTCTITGNNGALSGGFVFTGVSFTQCSFEGKIQGINVFLSLWNCQVLGTAAVTNGEAIICSGVIYGGQSLGSNFSLDGYVCLAGQIGDGIQPGTIVVGAVVLYIFASDMFNCSKNGTQILLQAPLFTWPVEVVGHGSRYMWRMSGGAQVLNPNGLSWVTMMQATTSTFAVLEGQFNAMSFDPVALTFGLTAIAVTPANLDLSIVGGGFGGWAVNPVNGTALRKQQP